MDAGPLTRRERLLVWGLSVAVAVSRWPAVSRTLWDWDEALFALALRDYDVAVHHPHPPGFPLFIAVAKLIPLDSFHALQCVTVIASLFVFPAMFFLARALRAEVPAAITAGLLLAFFPNVWFFGGTAFSDVPSMVLVVVACALLLRGQVLLGSVVLGVAAGFRPQNLLIGFVPFLIAFRHRWREGLAGGAIIAAIVIASYGAAASLSGGWDVYRATLAKHEQYIRTTDSFLAPNRPWLPQVADDFFFWPYRAPLLNGVIAVFALLGIVRRRNWIVLATFGPFLLFAWLYLDFHSASRFSIAYMPLFAMLAAEGMRFRAVTTAAIVAYSAFWSWPALHVVHTTVAPPVAAIEALKAMHPRRVLVDGRLAAHADLLMPEVPRELVRVRPSLVIPPGAVLLQEGGSIAPGAKNFVRERRRLESIARPRYFEVSIKPRA